jgi:hypothetical protein
MMGGGYSVRRLGPDDVELARRLNAMFGGAISVIGARHQFSSVWNHWVQA